MPIVNDGQFVEVVTLPVRYLQTCHEFVGATLQAAKGEVLDCSARHARTRAHHATPR